MPNSWLRQAQKLWTWHSGPQCTIWLFKKKKGYKLWLIYYKENSKKNPVFQYSRERVTFFFKRTEIWVIKVYHSSYKSTYQTDSIAVTVFWTCSNKWMSTVDKLESGQAALPIIYGSVTWCCPPNNSTHNEKKTQGDPPRPLHLGVCLILVSFQVRLTNHIQTNEWTSQRTNQEEDG